MPNIQALSRERHAKQGWQANRGYGFVANDAYLPLTLQELPLAMMSLTIAFLASAQGMLPVAVTGVQPGKNLLVGPDGSWLYGYLPEACRHYPFCIASTPNGEQVLCIDEDAEVIVDEAVGETFFDSGKNPTPGVLQQLESLKNYEKQKQQTLTATRLLEEKKILSPLDLGINLDGTICRPEGLFKVSEDRLRALSRDDLGQLRDTGGLAMIYCHHLSLQHWSALQQLAEAHQRLTNAMPTTPTGIGETLDFSGFR